MMSLDYILISIKKTFAFKTCIEHHRFYLRFIRTRVTFQEHSSNGDNIFVKFLERGEEKKTKPYKTIRFF